MIVNPVTIGGIAFACVFGGALLGMLLRQALPNHHLSTDSKDVVKLGMGLVGTMAALALGLLLASAKSSYDAQADELRRMSATIILLDRVLAHYGPEAGEARGLLREATARALRLWSAVSWRRSPPPSPPGRDFYTAIAHLSPQSDTQRLLQAQMLRICIDLWRLRLLLSEERERSMPMPFLVMLVFWLTIIFVSFGLFAPRNGTVVMTMFVCALSVSGAIYLILDLAHPFRGWLEISSAPLRDALQNLARPKNLWVEEGTYRGRIRCWYRRWVPRASRRRSRREINRPRGGGRRRLAPRAPLEAM